MSDKLVTFGETVYSTMPLFRTERFWSNIHVCPHGDGCQDCCWEWQGPRTPKGYGICTIACQDNQTFTRGAHRLAYLFTCGDFPGELYICHHCDNPSCCNPAHLWVGTQTENFADMYQKGRGPTGERNGSRTHPERRPRGDQSPRRLHPEWYVGKTRNGKAALTPIQVEEIRALASTCSHREIARRFGLSSGHVNKIIHRKTWGNI